MALVLGVTVLVPVAMNPPTVEAAWNGIIMPGRVLRDWGPNPPVNSSACRAIAYGRVDSNLVLFVAQHCKIAFMEQPYAPALTNGSVQLGWWGVGTATSCNCPTSWEDNDLTYITLDVNSPYYPTSNRNLIYRGPNGIDNYWHITTQPGQFDGCEGFPAGGAYPDTSYRMWQKTMTSTYQLENRDVKGLHFHHDGCEVFTDGGQHNDCCDSATPIIRYSDQTTLNGFLTGVNTLVTSVDEGTKPATGTNGNPAMFFNPMYEGLQDLDAYFDTHGNHTGAKLCINSACT